MYQKSHIEFTGIIPIDSKVRWSFDTSILTNDIPLLDIRQSIIKAFDFWSEHTGLEFVEDNYLTQICIKFRINGDADLPQPFEQGVCGYAYFPSGQSRGLHSDIFINDFWHWGVEKDFYDVFLHEVGHALGLEHVPDKIDIMYPEYEKGKAILLTDTLTNIQKVYGFAKSEPKTVFCLIKEMFKWTK